MADRYFYIPSIGLFIALVFGLADIAKSWRVAPSLSAGIAVAVLLILATLTNAQIQRWRDSFTLFEHTLAVTPPNLRIEHNLGLALGASGRYDEAAAHFEKALQIDPNFYDGLVGMGVTRAHQGRAAGSHRVFPSSNPFTAGRAESARAVGPRTVERRTAIKPRLRRCAARRSLRPKTQTFGLTLDSRWAWRAEYRRLSSNFTKRSG